MNKNVSSALEKTGVRRPVAANEQSLYAIDGGRKYLNTAERQRVLCSVNELDPRKALFILTLAWTGARVSEVLALTPSSFQPERCIVSFKTLKRRRHSIREVPLPSDLVAALEAEFALKDFAVDPNRPLQPLWPWSRVTAWRIVKAQMKAAGISGVSASPRGFRHGFGVATLQAGVPLNLVQRWLGHASMSTTAIYADASGPEERAFAQAFWQKNAKI